jgi:DNA-binding transcriptional ArsR family regulator
MQQKKTTTDIAAETRAAILAALGDEWQTSRQIAAGMGITHATAVVALRPLVDSGHVDWRPRQYGPMLYRRRGASGGAE